MRLDSEMRACFLLNEHGDLYFLLHNNTVHVIFFNLKKMKTNYRKEKKKTDTTDDKDTVFYCGAKNNTLIILHLRVLNNKWRGLFFSLNDRARMKPRNISVLKGFSLLPCI